MPADEMQALLEQLADQYESVNRLAPSQAADLYPGDDDDSDEW